MDFKCGYGPTRVVSNSHEEGYLSTSKGKVELHCNNNSFESRYWFAIHSNEIENPTKLFECLPPSLESLHLSEIVFGKLESNAFSRFIYLDFLDLSETYLEDFDFSILHNVNQLSELDISRNKLGKLNATTFENFTELVNLNLSDTHLSFDNFSLFDPLINLSSLDISSNNMENISFSKSIKFTKLIQFYARNCKITNAKELLSIFGSSLWTIDLSDNFLSEVDSTIFSSLTNLSTVILRNTSISFHDYNIFESNKILHTIDLSYNNFEMVDLNSIFHHLREIIVLSVTNCNIKKVSNIKLSLPSLVELDLSGNDLGEIESSIFENLRSLEYLNLSNMNLSQFDFNLIFKQQHRLRMLNISHNHLKQIDLTFPKECIVENLYLEENDLTEIHNLILVHLQMLTKLSISRNQLSCEFLNLHVPQLENWVYLNLIGDSWNQKHGKNCSSVNASTETKQFINATFTPWIYITIGVSILSVVVIGTVFVIYCKKCFKKTGSKEYDEPRIISKREEKIEMSRISGELPEILASPLESTSHEENIYEEIRDVEGTYDHLQHEPQPIPIATNNFYHNFLLIDRNSRNKM